MTVTKAAPVVGVVLAGGQSRRMGRDKALLCLPDGRTLLEQTAAALGVAGVIEVALSVSTPERGDALRDAVPALAHLRLVVDSVPDCGPLGGLHAALRDFPESRILLVACDMPRLDPAALRWLVHESWDADAIVPVIDGRDQPLHALYGSACHAVAERLLREGRLAMRDLLAAPSLRVLRLDERALSGAGIAPAAFANVNTPDDLAALERTHD